MTTPTQPTPTQQQTPQQSTALVQFDPANLKEAIELSKTIADSALLPPDLQKKASDVLVMFLTGRDLGLTAMQSIQSINVIKGRPQLSAKLKVALVRRSPVCKYFRLIETTDEVAVYATQREGNEPVRMRFSMEDAKRAGLVHPNRDGSPGMYQRFPAAMLRARCASQLCDAEYQDVLLNLADDVETLAQEEIDRALTAHRGAPVPAREAIVESKPVQDSAPPAVPAKKPDVVDVPWEPEKSAVAAKSAEPAPGAAAQPPAVSELKGKIEAAASVAELEALVPELQKLPKDQVGPLREAYIARRAAVTAPAKPAESTPAPLHDTRTGEVVPEREPGQG